MANIGGKLVRYWQEWGSKLDVLVDAKGSKLVFPQTLRETRQTDATYTVQPIAPIFIYNAPYKSSGRAGQMQIFIDGMFELTKAGDPPTLRHASCNVTFFKSIESPGESISLTLVDALHFDVESPKSDGSRTRFHPVFHAQRGLSVTDEVCKSVVAEFLRLPQESVLIDQAHKEALGTPFLRIPTPQLDVFSVITMIAADYFCYSGDASDDAKVEKLRQSGGRAAPKASLTNVEEKFVQLLDLLRKPTNMAREGETLVMLKNRFEKAGHVSTAHWYPECN